MQLRQPGSTYNGCGSFTKNKERIQKAWFQHNMASGDFKDSPRRTSSDKVLRDKAFNIAKILRYDEHQRGLASMIY